MSLEEYRGMTCAVVVTGASRGIGLATARMFAAAGYEAVSLSRTAPDDAAIGHIETDITDLASVDRAARQLGERSSDWDQLVLLHNAALHRHDTVSDLDGPDFLQVLTANLVAPQMLNRALIPLMGAGSSILYIGSTLAEKAVAGAASYVVSKHGMIGLMRATCQDLAGRNIHTACICPGFTDTEMLRAHLGDAVDGITGMVAAGRLVMPDEIARLALFCAQNPALNGAVLHANLGQIER